MQGNKTFQTSRTLMKLFLMYFKQEMTYKDIVVINKEPRFYCLLWLLKWHWYLNSTDQKSRVDVMPGLKSSLVVCFLACYSNLGPQLSYLCSHTLLSRGHKIIILFPHVMSRGHTLFLLTPLSCIIVYRKCGFPLFSIWK